MSKLHIGHGNWTGDKAWLERATKSRRPGSWMVPKTAKRGDELVVKVGNALFATAKISSDPWPRRDRKGRYNARIERVRLINPPISLAVVRKRIPEWRWTDYPRNVTTPSERVTAKIRSLIADRRSRRGADAIDMQSDDLEDRELRQVAFLCAKKSVDPKMRLVAVRDRSRWIHRWVIRRAAGTCEGCGKKAPFLRADGTPYLEPHHTVHLGRDDGPDDPRTVIALCPTCHKRVHHAHDGEKYNQSLKSKLKHLERSIP